ncbi:unnamed protein product [Pieris brassicae]|uniref:Peptidase S1 domain-containing protein n=1 Tax=Pieris brassicae TaxID=7116 RepID=A0A9P0T989_PIEBR|nr:unnamed protein product [Pieris brassicae]
MEGFVVGGEYAQIAQYPHSVFLDIYCGDSYICGGSLVTNQLVLTAAHCLSSCQSVRRDHIIIKYGHEVIDRMRTQSVRKFVKHRHYNDDTLVFDIAMVMARNAMQLGRFVKRVALMSKYPKQPSAGYIAGWGVINSEQEESVVLKATVQKFQPNNVCSLLGRLPVGTYCAGPITGRGAPDQGDSGSAFVIQGYIQIGIVSYKNPRYSLVVYTNTTYHYDWILRTAKSDYIENMIFELIFLAFVKFSCAFEGFVVGGDKAQIEYFAHSVFLSIRDVDGAYICGSSILNQKILLSAAHCFESCTVSNIYAFVGNAHKSKGIKYRVSTYKIHESYDEDHVTNDIGLAVLQKPLTLGDNAKRVAIVKSPPIKKLAIVAGWGLIDEEDGVRSNWLHSSNQRLWTLSECRRVLPGIPAGSLCAGDTTEESYASE